MVNVLCAMFVFVFKKEVGMFVYFIQDGKGNGGAIKIGKAKNVQSRLDALQIGNPRKLSIMATIKCKSCKEAEKLEKELHKKFKYYRIRGEWFSGNIKLHSIQESFDIDPPEEITLTKLERESIKKGSKIDKDTLKKYHKIKKIIWQKMGKHEPSKVEMIKFLQEETGCSINTANNMKKEAVKYCEERGLI